MKRYEWQYKKKHLALKYIQTYRSEKKGPHWSDQFVAEHVVERERGWNRKCFLVLIFSSLEVARD